MKNFSPLWFPAMNSLLHYVLYGQNLWSEVVAVGQTFRSISSEAGLQLLNVLRCPKVHSTTTQTMGECEERSVTNTHCGLETFMWSTMLTHASLASLHAPQVRVLTTYTTVATKWSISIVSSAVSCHALNVLPILLCCVCKYFVIIPFETRAFVCPAIVTIIEQL